MRWETGSVMCFYSTISIRQIYMKISTALHYHSSQRRNISLHGVLIICLCCYLGYCQFFTIISSAKLITLMHTSLSIETIFLGVRGKKLFSCLPWIFHFLINFGTMRQLSHLPASRPWTKKPLYLSKSQLYHFKIRVCNPEGLLQE